MKKPKLAFISPVFLFPTDAGGKIRTTNILRGLKGGAFDITLLSPALAGQEKRWEASIKTVSDTFQAWPSQKLRPRLQRALDLFREIPVNVAADNTPSANQFLAQSLSDRTFDLVVFDFVHAAILKPKSLKKATVCFTHNVEAEIFGRHAQQATNPIMRRIWSSQHEKMLRFEGEALRTFNSVIAVSERDAQMMRDNYRLSDVFDIPTGVDLDFFHWQPSPLISPETPPTVIFTGSMNWDANIDGVKHFLDDVWPLVLQEIPEARFIVVGKNPPDFLVDRGSRLAGVSFTGFVDDVRPYVQNAHVFVIPLRIGGGTRIKAFEAMAMGCPMVSTAIGIEGLDIVPDEHFLLRDSADEQAEGIVMLLRNELMRESLSRNARNCVEAHFGHQVAAQAFEKICLNTVEKYRASGHARH